MLAPILLGLTLGFQITPAANPVTLKGTVTVRSSASASATVVFSTTYERPPECVLTPTTDPTSVGAYWVTSTSSAFTVNLHTASTITFNYVCVGI